MTIFELEDALVEFVGAQTADLVRFRSNEQTFEVSAPKVWSGFVPRDEVGGIIPGEITTYPAIIIAAQSGSQMDMTEAEQVTVGIVIGCFDAELDQQGYRDCALLLQLLKDRFRETSVIREQFGVIMPLSWQLNRRASPTQTNTFPYYFGELQVTFEMGVMESQFEVGIWDGDVTPGRYNALPIPTPIPNEHWKYPVPPPIKWEEHFSPYPVSPPPYPQTPIP